MKPENTISPPSDDVERDQRGWHNKFRVARIDGEHKAGKKHDGCEYFVLDLTHDPHAVATVMLYGQHVYFRRPGLYRDIVARYPGAKLFIPPVWAWVTTSVILPIVTFLIGRYGL